MTLSLTIRRTSVWPGERPQAYTRRRLRLGHGHALHGPGALSAPQTLVLKLSCPEFASWDL